MAHIINKQRYEKKTIYEKKLLAKQSNQPLLTFGYQYLQRLSKTSDTPSLRPRG